MYNWEEYSSYWVTDHEIGIALSEVDAGRVEIGSLMQCLEYNTSRQGYRGLELKRC